MDPLANETHSFEHVPLWPRFAVITEELSSGHIPVTRIGGWRDLRSILEDGFFARNKAQYAFRGQRRWDWALAPTLGRLSKNDIVSDQVARKQLDNFRKHVRGRLRNTDTIDDPELWSIGQHHGLKTPLLDWTYSPYVALFFAFVEADTPNDNPYRALYALNRSALEELDSGDIRVLEPKKDDHGRLVNQAGLFTYARANDTVETILINALSADPTIDTTAPEVLSQYICKIYIPNEDRESCLRHLRQMNVHHASLFPDLIGASQHCNVLIAEDIEPDKSSQAGAIATQPSAGTQPASPTRTVVPPRAKVRVSEEWLRIPRLEPAAVAELAAELNKTLEEAAKDPASATTWLGTIVPITLRRHGYSQERRDDILAKILQLVPSAQE